MQGIRKYDVVDIFGIVFEMRKERVWMVQTEQQYICIHQVIPYVHKGQRFVPGVLELWLRRVIVLIACSVIPLNIFTELNSSYTVKVNTFPILNAESQV